MSKKKKKVQAESVAVPKTAPLKVNIDYRATQPAVNSVEEMEHLIEEISEIQKNLIRVRNRYSQRLDDAKSELRQSSVPLERQLNIRLKAVFDYATPREAELTKGKSRTVKLVNGTIGWRKNPASLVIENESDLLEQLRTKGLSHFIRVVESVNREALLSDRRILGVLSGVRLAQSQRMFVHPDNRPEERLDENGVRLRRGK